MHKEIIHPLLDQKLSLLRSKDTKTKEFRELASQITTLIAYEALKDLELSDYKAESPMGAFTGKKIKNEVVVVPVLRAGLGMLDAFITLVPESRVGFVGLYRDHETHKPVSYYENFPQNLKYPHYYIIDPMLATGGSLISTVTLLKESGAEKINILSIIAAPEGIATLEKAHSDISIYCGSIDEKLDENKYIIPGLGDAGDRLFGTQ